MNESAFQTPEDFLIQQEGVPEIVIDKWKEEGFIHTTMICQDLN